MNYSVITPIYNREDCIARCLDSVAGNLQWGVEFEHIVVDDGSTDGTASIVQEYAARCPHIRFIRFDGNRGTNAARNAAIAAATGDFCILLDSDDYFVPKALQIIDGTVQAGGYRHYCFAADDMMAYYKSNPLLADSGHTVIRYEDFLLERIKGDFIHVIATDTLRKYPFDEQLRIYEGVFFKRFYREAQEVLFTPEVVTLRERDREDSVTRDVLLRDRKTMAKGLKSKQLLADGFGDDLLRSEEGRAILHKTYAAMLELNLLLNDYAEARKCREKIESLGVAPVQGRLELIRKLHLGRLYYALRVMYVFIRYDLLKAKIS